MAVFPEPQNKMQITINAAVSTQYKTPSTERKSSHSDFPQSGHGERTTRLGVATGGTKRKRHAGNVRGLKKPKERQESGRIIGGEGGRLNLPSAFGKYGGNEMATYKI
jgi:hypothetical protein